MILTVTANPAIDVTYRVAGFRRGGVHRVQAAAAVPGGKGVNVARVLHQLGEPVHAVGLADARFAGRLSALGLPATFVDAMEEVRRTVVVRSGETTSFWEPGPPVRPHAEDALLALVEQMIGTATAVVVSGSLPPGVGVDLPVRIGRLARDHAVPVILDLDDAALAAAADHGGAVLTPNADELDRLLGGPAADPTAAVRELADRTGAPVVLTRGEDGVIATDGASCWRASSPLRVDGNPTGAGDATAAGIARGLARGTSWPDLLRDAVALGAAAVRVETAGQVDLGTYEELLPQVRVTDATPHDR